MLHFVAENGQPQASFLVVFSVCVALRCWKRTTTYFISCRFLCTTCHLSPEKVVMSLGIGLMTHFQWPRTFLGPIFANKMGQRELHPLTHWEMSSLTPKWVVEKRPYLLIFTTVSMWQVWQNWSTQHTFSTWYPAARNAGRSRARLVALQLMYTIRFTP